MIDSGIVADTVVKVAETAQVAGMTISDSFLVSVTGMLIVFTALAGIALILSKLPLLMTQIAKVVPEPTAAPKKSARKQVSSNDDEAVAVAIALANHTAKGN